MKKMLLIILISLSLQCSHEREIQIQVRAEVWILVDKDPALREGDNDFVWLIWENQYRIQFREKVDERHADYFPIGLKVVNRTRN